MPRAQVGVIGGSGFYEMAGFTDQREVAVETPFGSPSDALTVGQLGGLSVAFLPRHGRGHRITPSELPVQANIYALKRLGVQWVISVGAVGSMREEIRPLDLVVPDQLFDRTRSRPSTFFGEGLVVHVSLAEPFCPLLSKGLIAAARQVGARVHAGGTYICIEGPQFSTKAESQIYRQWGVDVIGMTALP
ncbi:MAG: S-methyl-5'-thioadenosine phosphorylase, partial [Dehalococcoidia bacterium]|nr:S-methyl-5'-thioadenosine phosphorylase [Dehalococcoidia bacterium]